MWNRYLLCGAMMMLVEVSLPAAQTAVPYEAAKTRAQAIIHKMSLDEKVAEVHGIQDEDHYRYVPPLPRLDVPVLRITNGPAGVGPGGAGSQLRATAFPAPIALAATWDPTLAEEYGRVAGEEARALNYDLLESPDINIARVPQGGRVFESYGEDPYLVGRMAVANINGIQSAGVMANVKHFLANNQETDRLTINEIVSERALREIYMPAFEASVKQGYVASVMCAYPKVNGAYNCENASLLRDVLKREWGFDGFVTSDFFAAHSTAGSINAGLDLELPTGVFYGDILKKAIQSHQISEAALDAMLERRFAKMIQFGLFKPKARARGIDIQADGFIARSIAEQGMVLLKNDNGLLPLEPRKIHSIALLGPYAVKAKSGGSGSSHVIPFYSIEPVDGIDAALLSQTKIFLEDGTDIQAATKAAKAADLAIVMIGDDEGEDHDHSIDLSENQNRLVESIAGANSKTIVVIKSGSAVLMPWLKRVSAVLEAWYPGEEDGNAVADVLFGKVNPSGKLPLTFPASAGETLAAKRDQFPGDGRVVHYGENLNVGYRAFQSSGKKPLFPFGFGLSYTTFQFSDLIVAPTSDGALVRFHVKNVGKCSGTEVAQLYVTFPQIEEGNEPPNELRGFQKIMLAAGEDRVVELALNHRDLAYWSDVQHRWRIPDGSFQFSVGDSSENLPLHGSFNTRAFMTANEDSAPRR